MKLATISVALVNETEFAFIIAPPVLHASTLGTVTKFVPVIVTLVAVFSIVLGDIELIVGLVSPTVTLPPRLTAPPLIVIAELAKEALGILAAVTLRVSLPPSPVSVKVIPVLPVAVSLAPR